MSAVDGAINEVDDLGHIFAPAGCSHVKTFDGSGNVLTDTATDPLTAQVRIQTYTWSGSTNLTKSVWVNKSPLNSVLPALTVTARVGVVLSCSTGTWSNSPSSYSYQWQWDDGTNAAGSSTASTYTPIAADFGHRLRCKVTAVTSLTSIPQLTLATEPVGIALNSLTLSVNTFSNGSLAGTVIGAIQGLTSGSVIEVEPADGRVAIAGSNLVIGLSKAAPGKFRVQLRESPYGHAEAAQLTTLSLTVTDPGNIDPPAKTVSPAVTGSANVGATLSCTTGTWTGSPTGYGYQWQWADTGGNAAGSSTASTYVPVSGDIGHTLKCVVSATNAGGTVSASSNTTAAIANGPSLSAWPTALAAQRAGTRDAIVVFAGHSVTSGEISQPSSANAWSNSYSKQMCSTMALTGYAINAGSSFGSHNETIESFDTRWTHTGTGPSNLVSNWPFISIPAGATETFTPGVIADSYKIWYAQGSGNGTVTVNLNGGSTLATINSNGSAALLSQTVTGTAGLNALKLTNTGSNPFFVFAVEPTLSTAKQIRVHNWGWSGSKAADWASSATFGFLTTVAGFSPDLIFVGLEINDWAAPTNTLTYTTQMQSIITAAVATGADVVLFHDPASNTANYTQTVQDTFRAITTSLASSNNLLLIDQAAFLGGSYAAASASSLMADNVHPNGPGHALIAAGVLAVIDVPVTGVPGQVTGLTATVASSTSITLNWKTPTNGGTGITDYVLQSRVSPSGSWTTFSHSPSNATSATITGLTNGTPYDFQVAAVNPSGTGTYSAAATQTPSAADQFLRFSSPGGSKGSDITESADGSGFDYRATTGPNYSANNVMVTSVKIPSGQDGYGYITAAKSGYTNGPLIGLDASASLTQFTAWAYGVFIIPGNQVYWQVITGGSAAAPDVQVTFAQNDMARMRRSISGTSVYAEISKDSGATWTVIKTWTGALTGDLYFHAQIGDNGALGIKLPMGSSNMA